MTRVESLVADLQKALVKLKEAVAAPDTELNRDATIQRFEFTFELSWKVMHAILVDNGIETYGPKNTFREAAKLGVIESPEEWFEFLQDRNLTTHKYDEATAERIYQTAKAFVAHAAKLLETINTKFLSA